MRTTLTTRFAILMFCFVLLAHFITDSAAQVVSLPETTRTNSVEAIVTEATAANASIMAILVNDTNYLTATWTAFQSNITINLGAGDGIRSVLLGFQGTNEVERWQSFEVEVDTQPPQLLVTDPQPGTVIRPMLQIHGFCLEKLSSINYVVSNESSLFTNGIAFITDRFWDESTGRHTTNWFECLDVPLTAGTNLVMITATDIAGNISLASLSYVLDTNLVTNAPAFALTWPFNESQVAGNNFTLRGAVDDATVTIKATVATGGQSPLVFEGLVERDGRVWVDNIPLLPGTNTISVQITDFLGNTSTTNVTVVKSALDVTVDTLPGESIWNSSETISGTVSATDHTIWVNGVQATLDGNSWSAANVPLEPGGTLILTIAAIPNSANNGAGNLQPGSINPTAPNATYFSPWFDRPYRVYVKGALAMRQDFTRTRYDKLYNSGRVVWALRPGDTNLEIKRYNNLTGKNYSHVIYAHTDSYDSDRIPASHSGGYSGTWAATWPAPTTMHAGMLEVLPQNVTITGECYMWPEHYQWRYSWPGFMERGRFSGANNIYSAGSDAEGSYSSSYRHTFARVSNVELRLHTGGRSAVNRRSLFVIRPTADALTPPSNYIDEYINPNVIPRRTLPPSSLWLPGIPGPNQRAGNDGLLYAVLPENREFIITPEAPVRWYSFEVNATKHRLHIYANSVQLRQQEVVFPAAFSVGEKVNFTFGFSPDVDTIQTYSWRRWNFSGKFVNDWSITGTEGSRNYFIRPLLLTIPQTHVWWLSGGLNRGTAQSIHSAQIMFEVVFNNGQSVLLAERGLVDVHRPDCKPQVSGNEPWHSSPGARMNGDSLILDNDAMQFWLTTLSYRPGRVKFTQVCNISMVTDGVGGLSSVSTAGQYWLDTSDPYNDSRSIVEGVWSPWNMRDGPSSPGASTSIAIDNRFNSYFMFRPGPDEGESDNIWVTLGMVTWYWNASSNKQNDVWQITSDCPAPVFQTSDAFPPWIYRLDLD